MRTAVFISMVAVIAFVVSCEKNPASDSFENKLEFGTGSSGFSLTGTGTTFSRGTGGSLQLYWRLESAADMAGSEVMIKIEPVAGGTPVSQTYANPQNYGHIMLSSITVTAAGSYRATGILVAGNKTVASVVFTVN